MAEPLVPSSSNNLPRGWTFRVMLSQNWELMLETCDPELIKAVILCPSTITGASLDHPTRQAIGSLFKKGTIGSASHGTVCWAAFMLAGLSPESGWECEGPTVGWGGYYQWGVSHIPLAPPGLV